MDTARSRPHRLPVRELTLLPIQPLDDVALQAVLEALRIRGVNVHCKRAILRPRGSYSTPRRQLRADVLLESVARCKERPILGLTDADCYAGRLHFVFGIADVGQGAAVVSLFRLRIHATGSTFIERAMKEIFHELGHAAGLRHCPNSRCVMHFSNSLVETDFKEEHLCAACAAEFMEK